MDFSSANQALWNGILSCGIVAALVLVGNILRTKVKLIRNALIPTSVLAGFLGMFLRELGIIRVDTAFLDMLTYHALAIGFIALSLRTPRVADTGGKKGKAFYESVNTGMFIVSNYLLQGILGLVITIIASYTFAPGFFKAAGILLPMGYGQGPGQANNIGTLYETLGFVGGQNFGLAIASMGFVWASIGGIAYLIYLKRKGQMPKEATVSAEDQASEILEEADEVPLTEPIDRLTMQLALVFIIYAATYAFAYGFLWIFQAVPALHGVYNTLSPLVWGFNFLIASSMALAVRALLGSLRSKGIMTRQYTNNYLLNRISGFAFDVMIVGAISTVSIGDLSGMWPVFLIVTTLGGILTLYYDIKVAKIIYPDYPVSGMMGMYGMMTGTASTGVMLLRETDPLFRTPMSTNLVSGSSTAIVFAIPVLVFVALAPQSDRMVFVSLAACIVYFLILHFALIKRARKWNEASLAKAADK